jgi:hypothetical protein
LTHTGPVLQEKTFGENTGEVLTAEVTAEDEEKNTTKTPRHEENRKY